MFSYEELSTFEKEAIAELKTRVQHLGGSTSKHAAAMPEITLCRFLKARNFDVDKAELMIRKTSSWRKAHQIDTILEDFQPKEYYLKYSMPNELGFNKDGNMVYYFPVGGIEGRDVLKCDSLNGYLRHWMWFTELSADKSYQFIEENSKQAYMFKMIFIVDLEKLTFSNLTYKHSINAGLRLFGFLSDNYPECLETMYMVNAPSFYILGFNIIKAVMSQEMLQKIQIHGRVGWQEKLLKQVDPDIIPKFLGGNRTDPDGNPMCKSIMRGTGGKIPEKYYLPEKERWFKDGTRVKKVKISPKGKEEICVDVAENGSKIQWEFLLKNDIGFGLSLKLPEEETPTEILPIQKYDTLFGLELGWYRARCAGQYIIIFDNSHSWMTSKEVQYCITVIKPR